MNTCDCYSKFQMILNDRSKFQVDQKQDANSNITKSVSTELNKLKSSETITSDLQTSSTTSRSSDPRLYDLPKIYKDDVPLRQIVSMTRSALELWSKWLVDTLKPVEISFTMCVKDSFDSMTVAEYLSHGRHFLHSISLYGKVSFLAHWLCCKE